MLLDAAHIRPHSKQGDYSLQNGIILRTDLHTLFDVGMIRIDPAGLTITVDDSIVDPAYRMFHGQKLRCPDVPSLRPSEEHLTERWDSD